MEKAKLCVYTYENNRNVVGKNHAISYRLALVADANRESSIHFMSHTRHKKYFRVILVSIHEIDSERRANDSFPLVYNLDEILFHLDVNLLVRKKVCYLLKGTFCCASSGHRQCSIRIEMESCIFSRRVRTQQRFQARIYLCFQLIDWSTLHDWQNEFDGMARVLLVQLIPQFPSYSFFFKLIPSWKLKTKNIFVCLMMKI